MPVCTSVRTSTVCVWSNPNFWCVCSDTLVPTSCTLDCLLCVCTVHAGIPPQCSVTVVFRHTSILCCPWCCVVCSVTMVWRCELSQLTPIIYQLFSCFTCLYFNEWRLVCVCVCVCVRACVCACVRACLPAYLSACLRVTVVPHHLINTFDVRTFEFCLLSALYLQHICLCHM